MTWDIVLTIITSLVAVFAAGRFDALQTGIRDNPATTKIYSWVMNSGWDKEKQTFYFEWLMGIGGNVRWNPALPSIPFLGIWYADAWHSCKHAWIYSWSIAVGVPSMILVWILVGTWQGVSTGVTVALLTNFVEGTAFQLIYATLDRTDRTFDFWQFLRERNPFMNYRK
jgi:hypothetical protein